MEEKEVEDQSFSSAHMVCSQINHWMPVRETWGKDPGRNWNTSDLPKGEPSYPLKEFFVDFSDH